MVPFGGVLVCWAALKGCPQVARLISFAKRFVADGGGGGQVIDANIVDVFQDGTAFNLLSGTTILMKTTGLRLKGIR